MRQDRQFAALLNIDARNAPLGVVYLAKEIQNAKSDIAKMENALRDYPALLEQRIQELALLEGMLARHPASPDGSNLKPVRRNKERSIPYGNMAKTICQVLRGRKGEPVPTFKVTLAVVQIAGLDLGRKELHQFNKQVLRSLNYLKSRGEVIRENAPEGSKNMTEAYWRVSMT